MSKLFCIIKIGKDPGFDWTQSVGFPAVQIFTMLAFAAIVWTSPRR